MKFLNVGFEYKRKIIHKVKYSHILIKEFANTSNILVVELKKAMQFSLQVTSVS